MKTFWGIYLAATLLVALVVGAFVVGGLPELLPPGTVVEIEGERHRIGDIEQLLAAHWFCATLAVLFVAALLVVVVPAVAILAVGLPLLAGALGAGMALLMLALVAAPFVLLARWLWQTLRRDGRTIPP